MATFFDNYPYWTSTPTRQEPGSSEDELYALQSAGGSMPSLPTAVRTFAGQIHAQELAVRKLEQLGHDSRNARLVLAAMYVKAGLNPDGSPKTTSIAPKLAEHPGSLPFGMSDTYQPQGSTRLPSVPPVPPGIMGQQQIGIQEAKVRSYPVGSPQYFQARKMLASMYVKAGRNSDGSPKKQTNSGIANSDLGRIGLPPTNLPHFGGAAMSKAPSIDDVLSTLGGTSSGIRGSSSGSGNDGAGPAPTLTMRRQATPGTLENAMWQIDRAMPRLNPGMRVAIRNWFDSTQRAGGALSQPLINSVLSAVTGRTIGAQAALQMQIARNRELVKPYLSGEEDKSALLLSPDRELYSRIVAARDTGLAEKYAKLDGLTATGMGAMAYLDAMLGDKPGYAIKRSLIEKSLKQIASSPDARGNAAGYGLDSARRAAYYAGFPLYPSKGEEALSNLDYAMGIYHAQGEATSKKVRDWGAAAQDFIARNVIARSPVLGGDPFNPDRLLNDPLQGPVVNAIAGINPITGFAALSHTLEDPYGTLEGTVNNINNIWGLDLDGKPIGIRDRVEGGLTLLTTALPLADRVGPLWRGARPIPAAIEMARSTNFSVVDAYRVLRELEKITEGKMDFSLLDVRQAARQLADHSTSPVPAEVVAADRAFQSESRKPPAGAVGNKPPPIEPGYAAQRGSQSGASSFFSWKSPRPSHEIAADIQELRSQLRLKLQQGISGRRLIPDAATLGARYLEAGLRRFSDWSSQMLRDLGKSVQPYLRQIRGLSEEILYKHVLRQTGQVVSARVRQLDPSVLKNGKLLSSDLAALFEDPQHAKLALKTLSRYPGMGNMNYSKGETSHFLAMNQQDLHDSLPAALREAARKTVIGNNRIANRLAGRYGIPLENSAATLAILSPQKYWPMNVSLAEKMIRIYMDPKAELWTDEMSASANTLRTRFLRNGNLAAAGDVDRVLGKNFSELTNARDKGAWIRLYDEAHGDPSYQLLDSMGRETGYAKTKKGANAKRGWSSFDTLEKAVRAIEAKNTNQISDALGRGHKVRNFYNNIVDPWSKMDFVTVDSHQVAGSLARPVAGTSLEVKHAFGHDIGKSATSGMSGTYGVYSDATQRAARALGYRYSNQLQSVIWEADRRLFTRAFKTKANQAAARKVWIDFENGRLSREEAVRKVHGLASR